MNVTCQTNRQTLNRCDFSKHCETHNRDHRSTCTVLVVFDSFSVFVEPVSYQRNFHLVSVLYVTSPWRNIRSTAHFDFGSMGERFTLSKSITRRF